MFTVEQWCNFGEDALSWDGSSWDGSSWDIVSIFYNLHDAISMIRENAPIDATVRIVSSLDNCIYFISFVSINEQPLVLFEGHFVSLQPFEHEDLPNNQCYSLGVFNNKESKKIDDFDWKKEGF